MKVEFCIFKDDGELFKSVFDLTGDLFPEVGDEFVIGDIFDVPPIGDSEYVVSVEFRRWRINADSSAYIQLWLKRVCLA